MKIAFIFNWDISKKKNTHYCFF